MSSCSIVVPVRNRIPLTRQCLDALVDGPASVSCEIVVVDDGSTDTTPDVLAEYGDLVKVVAHEATMGFAAACNAGAAGCSGDFVVFLNNDTLPQPGWLTALVAHAERHPRAAAVGSKLLFPNGLVQHAGVVICQDGIPRHLYAGFPGDHAAVTKDRVLQAVTAACLLVRRAAFDGIGGFDTDFRNGFEDADLCLRLRDRGWEIHYCHRSVLFHLESGTRSRRAHDSRRNLKLFRSRWSDRVVADDVATYLADGLLAIEYGDVYPLELRTSPLLAVVGASREREVERVLKTRSRQVSELLREVARLTQKIGEDASFEPAPDADLETVGWKAEHAAAARRDDNTLRELGALQERLAETLAAGAGDQFEASETLLYRELVEQLKETVVEAVPAGATVLVVSNGDDELVGFAGRDGRHFPQGPSGAYAGYHPQNSQTALSHLRHLQACGAEYLVVPATSRWWLDHYAGLRAYLENHGELILRDDDVCWIFALPTTTAPRASHVGVSSR